ncbi:unnamed protein product [Brassicogethes aeneus]|uniref:Tachykinin n=1 Tax=Brassicogethes aeneus TaxID=1431903 RepID=A0A9P0FQL5_BRAAE|nr:unnamed protein product [Brassicogethes aeneus]
MSSVKRTIAVLLTIGFLCIARGEDHHKRAPSGFLGVRGKKSVPDDAYADLRHPELAELQAEDETSQQQRVVYVKRAPSGFMGMRGKKPFEYDVEQRGLSLPEDIFKRAPSGFMGMRGKKDWEFGEYAKRAPSGFFGMRGKKQYLDYYNDKRAPMGFVGMRGKKSVEDVGDVAFGEEKRAPQGFFGMRGKKLQGAQGFFGMRGKKYPYEFRGKFVGVRGKKYINEDLILNREYPRLDMNNLLLLLTENNNGETKLKPNVGEENQMEN